MREISRFEEKRESPRFRLGTPVEYRALKNSPDTKRGSLTSDISAGGVRFITEEFLALTARMVLDVTLPLPERPFSAVSKIAWIKKLPAGDKYEVGSQFLEISKDDKNRLSDYLNRLSATQPAR